MTTLFDLPENILSTIYEMDSTYRGKIREEINKEIFKKSFDIFRKKFVKNNYRLKDTPQIVAEKFDFVLKYISDKHLSEYEKGESDKPFFTDEIKIYSNYDKDTLYIDIDSSQTQFLEGWVYTIPYYNKMIAELYMSGKKDDKKYAERIQRDIVFRNDKFIIRKTTYDEDESDDIESEDEESDDEPQT